MLGDMDISKLAKTWDKEAKSYRFKNDRQVDYLANCYHLRACLGDLNGKKILEVGSGSGQISAYLASRGGKIHLVDISRRSLEFARKYFELKHLQVKIYNQDAFAMKFPMNSFDYVWNGGVIEHFVDEEKILMIKNMWKLVKPGGKLVITVPSAEDYPFMIAKKILELRKKWAFGFEDDLTRKRIAMLATKAGVKDFSVFAYNPIVGFWFFPYGREITNILGLNKLKYHKMRSSHGHVLVLLAEKP